MVEAPPLSRRTRRPDIQGLRAVAVLLVVLFHAGASFPGGFTGVDVFFVISGFVITGLLVRELAAGRIDLLRFYTRRARRLLPALALMLSAVAVVGALAAPATAQRTGGITGIFAAVFSANFYLAHLSQGYFDTSTALDPLLHTWTLAVEEQFYLVFPLVLLAAWRLGGRVAAGVAVAGVSAASLLGALALARGGHGPAAARFAFYSSPTRAWEFGTGAVLGLSVPLLARLPLLVRDALGVVGLAVIGIGAFAIRSTVGFPNRYALLPVVGAAAVLAAGVGEPGSRVSGRLLALPPAVWLGDLSYSWYLWHWPSIVFAKALWPGSGAAAPVAGAASLLPAWLSFRLVEDPIRTGRSVSPRRLPALVAVCVAVPVALCGGLVLTSHVLDSTAAFRSWLHSQAPHADQVRGCDATTPLDRRSGGACTWRVPAARGSIVLLGDSQAGQLTEGFVAAARRAGYDATVATYDACPFVLMVVTPRGGNGPCYRFVAETTHTLLRRRPNLVVLASRTDMYVEGYGIGRPGGPLTHATPKRLVLYEQGLAAVLATLNRAGVPVLVLHPIPMVPAAPDTCAAVLVLTHTCGGAVSRRSALAALAPAIRVENRAVAGRALSSAFSLVAELCSSTSCSASRGSTIMYWNPAHLSVDGAKAVSGVLYREIVARARR